MFANSNRWNARRNDVMVAMAVAEVGPGAPDRSEGRRPYGGHHWWRHIICCWRNCWTSSYSLRNSSQFEYDCTCQRNPVFKIRLLKDDPSLDHHCRLIRRRQSTNSSRRRKELMGAAALSCLPCSLMNEPVSLNFKLLFPKRQ